MNKISDTPVPVCAASWTVLIRHRTASSGNCCAANYNTMTVKFSSILPMRRIKFATPLCFWPNCTFSCKMYVHIIAYIIPKHSEYIAQHLPCLDYLQDGSRLTNIAHSIHHAINLLMPKLSPENIKCVCQTLKVSIWDLWLSNITLRLDQCVVYREKTKWYLSITPFCCTIFNEPALRLRTRHRLSQRNWMPHSAIGQMREHWCIHTTTINVRNWIA